MAATMWKLRRVLAEVAPVPDPARPIELPGSEAADLVDEFERLRPNGGSLLGPEYAELLASEWPLDRQSLDRVVAARDELLEDRALCHVDLHPHNLLLRGDQVVAVLDFASIRLAPVSVVEAFAAYKLLRQSVVTRSAADDPEQISAAADIFLLALRPGGELAGRDGVDAALLAQAEILRRLMYVLRAAARDDDRTWVHVLPVHLSGLIESEILLAAS